MEKVSLIGHFKLPKSETRMTPFSLYTARCLETHDLVKLLQLNKDMRAVLLKRNAKIYISNVFCYRINTLYDKVDEWSERCSDLQR